MKMITAKANCRTDSSVYPPRQERSPFSLDQHASALTLFQPPSELGVAFALPVHLASRGGR